MIFSIFNELNFTESFVVCQNYSPPEGYVPTMVNPLLDLSYDGSWQDLEGPNRVIVPFLACGDLSAYDSDMTYPLQVRKLVSCLLMV